MYTPVYVSMPNSATSQHFYVVHTCLSYSLIYYLHTHTHTHIGTEIAVDLVKAEIRDRYLHYSIIWDVLAVLPFNEIFLILLVRAV
jgi:hypothetical protein